MLEPRLHFAPIFAVALLCAPGASAQSLWGVFGPGRIASDTAGPPGCDPCPIAGPLLDEFDFGVNPGTGCAVPGPFPPPTAAGSAWSLGDITVDRVADTVWVTDGWVVTGYTRTGTVFADFFNPLPLALTGLGYQAPGTLWLTDGYHAAAVTAPTTCGTVPAWSGFFNVHPALIGLATDIDYDPCNDLLYVSGANGRIASMTTTGAPKDVFVLAGCLTTPFLSGLAVDTIVSGTLFVTDGVTITRVVEQLGSSPKTFVTAATTQYAPCACWPYAGTGGVTSGLAFDATPIETCAGCDPTGAPPPVLRATHQAISPNAQFGLAVAGAPPLPTFLVIGTCACPGFKLPCGCTLCINPMIVLALGIGGGPGGGLTVPMPAGWGCLGIEVCAQMAYYNPADGCVTTSNALHIGIAGP